MNEEKLLKLIKDNSRLSHEDIATLLGVTKEEVSTTIKKLEKENVIKGYKTLINWEKTNVGVATAVIEVKVTPQPDTGFDEIAKRISRLEEVESVSLMAGGFDLMLVVNAPTMQEVAMFVSKRLAPIGGVLSTATHFVLTKYKDSDTVFTEENSDERERELFV